MESDKIKLVTKVVAAFLASHSKGTAKVYSSSMCDFGEFLSLSDPIAAGAALLSMTSEEAARFVSCYRDQRMASGSSPSTVKLRLNVLRSLVRYAVASGVITWHLAVPAPASRPHIFNPTPDSNSLQSTLLALQGGNSVVIRNIALVSIIRELSLRRSEVIALDLADVELESARLWSQGKGTVQKQPRSMSPSLTKVIKKWIDVRGVEPGPLFVNLDRAMPRGRLSGVAIHRLIVAAGDVAGQKMTSSSIRRAGMLDALMHQIDPRQASELVLLREPLNVPRY